MRGSWRGKAWQERSKRKKKRESETERKGYGGICRVEGEIYLPAACADKIIRQKTPGVDDGKSDAGNAEEKRVQEKSKGERGVLQDQVKKSEWRDEGENERR